MQQLTAALAAPRLLRHARRALLLLGAAFAWWLLFSGGPAQADDGAIAPRALDPVAPVTQTTRATTDLVRSAPQQLADRLRTTTRTAPKPVRDVVDAATTGLEPTLTATTTVVGEGNTTTSTSGSTSGGTTPGGSTGGVVSPPTGGTATTVSRPQGGASPTAGVLPNTGLGGALPWLALLGLHIARDRRDGRTESRQGAETAELKSARPPGAFRCAASAYTGLSDVPPRRARGFQICRLGGLLRTVCNKLICGTTVEA